MPAPLNQFYSNKPPQIGDSQLEWVDRGVSLQHAPLNRCRTQSERCPAWTLLRPAPPASRALPALPAPLNQFYSNKPPQRGGRQLEWVNRGVSRQHTPLNSRRTQSERCPAWTLPKQPTSFYLAFPWGKVPEGRKRDIHR